MIRPTLPQIEKEKGEVRYDRGDRPWTMNHVDWHIVLEVEVH